MIASAKAKLVTAGLAASIVVCGAGGLITLAKLRAAPPVSGAPAPATSPATSPPTSPLSPKHSAGIAPATKPATQPASPTTPKGALLAFAQAARAGDAEGMKKLVKISDASEEQLLLAACDYVQAQSSLIGAVRDKFGDANANRLSKGIRMTILDSFLTSIETELDQTHEKIDGDIAQLITDDPNDDQPIALIRDGGIWKIHATGMTAKW